MIKKHTIWKVELNNGKKYKCIKYIFGWFSLSIISLGWNKFDIRLDITRGWE